MIEPTWQSDCVKLYTGDCRAVMSALDADSIDSIVTDPPYGLSFMGKGWDHGVPGIEFWQAALRVAKPGAHLLAFGGTRTFHRLACAIEDAGWEIRDCIMWVYGSGFPKSLDVSKAIDKAAGAEREVVSKGKPVKRMIPGADQDKTGSWIKDNGREFVPTETIPATETAQQWSGWGTALKPSWEPIIVARKPLIGTVAANVQQFGTGGINVDGCRVDSFQPGEFERLKSRADTPRNDFRGGKLHAGIEHEKALVSSGMNSQGRFPANLIHDGSEEVLAVFPDVGASPPIGSTCGSFKGKSQFANGAGGGFRDIKRPNGFGDTGNASRFFYCAKASSEDRGYENNHPTVKPFELMRYLCKLVTPQGGTVLDSFMGSGSTGKAAVSQGFGFIGIDVTPEYVAIAEQRIKQPVEEEKQSLFRDQIQAEREAAKQTTMFEA